MMLKVASCDHQSEVYIDSDVVYRLVKSNNEKSVAEVLEVINDKKINGIVQTEIITNDELKSAFIDSTCKLILKHKKIEYISYPHEWCASMLKDAALFHLELSENLMNQKLYLKDAHPWNILFEKGRPVFVDFTSIVSIDSLFAEEYLDANKLHKDSDIKEHLTSVYKEIYERMYVPYFVNALCGYMFGERQRIAKAIEKTTLNASTSIISFRDVFPSVRKTGLRKFPRLLLKVLNFHQYQLKIKAILNQLVERKEIKVFHSKLRSFISSLKVEIGDTAYSEYYKLKGEDNEWSYSDDWNDKQKTVYNALNIGEINTVLDVACNTGWFAVMAEKLGKHVIAFDIDEGCVEKLYTQIKNEELDILPLVMNFTDMTKDRYSLLDGNTVLINAQKRLCSDSVIALGIIHHLALGLGVSFSKILDDLIPLCKKQLVIEFVDKEDQMIQEQPSFFPAYFNNNELLKNYDSKKLIALIEERGFHVYREKSYPDTRHMLICTRNLIG